ncbi:WD-40 repeat protein [Reticulomyxa filosa]|uniref:WD-40 repeat protein n=1 Tax=Reticulomyxa filosa TaxID=46433 RepID=X6LXV2_RETFI|nr:WD-40 repeat protein [Reticulomyxa filosa]|eukprot:ETO05967.1 WD-40 repeat protein [Reticulomyxa filosa]
MQKLYNLHFFSNDTRLCNVKLSPKLQKKILNFILHLKIRLGYYLLKIFFSSHYQRQLQAVKRMTTLENKKQTSTQLVVVIFIFKFSESKQEEIQIIIQYWIRRLKIKLGWINDFNKLVTNYATTAFIIDSFRSSSKLLNTFTGHAGYVRSIDYSTLGDNQFICSGSSDSTIRIWDVDNNKQIQSFNEHSDDVRCVKFSQYYYHNNRQDVICSSSLDSTIRFWNIKNNRQLQIFDKHNYGVYGIEFSSFNGGRYLCSGSADDTIRLWDIKTSNSLHVFNAHTNVVCCVDISPLQSNNNKNDNKSNNIGIIGGNGYTICSGSFDKTIRIWDIETTKQLITFNRHNNYVRSVKYGLNELVNTILSGSDDESIRLWDIRSGKQIQMFNGHELPVYDVEYSPFVIENDSNLNVICSASYDNTVRFWDIRSNKNELYMINGDKEEDGILCLKFIKLKKKRNNKKKLSNYCNINLCYGSSNGLIRVWG